ncbi:hypothetical protein CEXT_353011 [Caerostris extrusa]|uniref:Uncharacterized protein n=1 Tax=Caerostris extrusa TaxID=172846 RepID=A0AAV4Q4G6_CAEEX|nr:hypothetical protein CEXT_353011 [Caerostris extrusa]
MAGRYARAQHHRSRETNSSQSSANRAHKTQQTGRSSTTTTAASRVAASAMEYYYAIVATVSGLSMVLYWNTLGADFAYDDRFLMRSFGIVDSVLFEAERYQNKGVLTDD